MFTLRTLTKKLPKTRPKALFFSTTNKKDTSDNPIVKNLYNERKEYESPPLTVKVTKK